MILNMLPKSPINKPIPITAIVLTHNEELNIEKCLKSIYKWCRYIFIVDSGSEDKTLEICRNYTSFIYTHSFKGFADQWSWALTSLPIETEWVLALDSDHVVSNDARKEISSVIHRDNSSIDGYFIKHKIFFRDQVIRGFKTYVMHLFRHKKTRLDFSEEQNRFIIDGKTAKLSTGMIYENNLKENDIDFWIDKHQNYANRFAIEEILRAKHYKKSGFKSRLFGDATERIMWFKSLWFRLPLYIRPVFYFLYRYFFRLGFLDGKNGFVYHFLQAFWFRMLIDIKISDINKKIANGDLTLGDLK